MLAHEAILGPAFAVSPLLRDCSLSRSVLRGAGLSWAETAAMCVLWILPSSLKDWRTQKERRFLSLHGLILGQEGLPENFLQEGKEVPPLDESKERGEENGSVPGCFQMLV